MANETTTQDTATYRSDYTIGFHDGIKAALAAAASGAQRGDDSRSMCVRAQIIEAIGDVKL